MSALRKWTVVLALIISVATPWSLLQSAAWFGMLVRYSQTVPLRDAVEMTFDGNHPCLLCKIVRQGMEDERERKPGASLSDTKFELALPALAEFAFYPPSQDSIYPSSNPTGQLPHQPPAPPPRLA
jgi:hypothetical protein